MHGQSLSIGIYARLSDHRSEEQTGTDRQVADCRAFAASKGWTITDVYVDQGISGFKRVERPEFERMMADLEQGRLDGVLAWKLDRLGRNRRDYTRLLEQIEGAGRTLALVAESVDTTSPFGRVALDLLASFARLESEQISMRTARALEEKAANGLPHTSGQRAFGLSRDWRRIVPEEAELVRQAARRIFDGETVNAICAEWNRAGVLTAAGKPWRPSSLVRTLKGPHLAGLRVHRGEVVGPGEWPAILDRATHERLKAILSDPARFKGLGGSRARYLLSGGLLRCGGPMPGQDEPCGSQMMSRPRGDKVRRYVCRRIEGVESCGRIGIVAEPLEELVAEVAIRRLASPAVVEALIAAADVDQSALWQKIRDDEQALQDLTHSRFVVREISHAEFLSARKALEASIAAARRRLAPSGRVAALADLPRGEAAIRAEWERRRASGNIRAQRAFLDLIIVHVEIGPAVQGLNHFDARRVRPTLRG